MSTTLNLSTVVCVLSMLGAGTALGVANHADVRAQAEASHADATGTIDSVSLDNNTFVLKTDNDIVTVKVNDSTAYTLDGQTSTRDETLKVGYAATVQHTDGTASKVEATSNDDD